MTDDHQFIKNLATQGIPFPINSDALDQDRAEAQAVLSQLGCAYQLQFDTFLMMTREGPLTFASMPATEEPAAGVRLFDNYEVKGTGDSPDEAMADWQRHLSTKPQAGSHLAWRIRPEIEWMKDFQAGKVIWRVYTRFAVLSC